jgi:hypothetical protein
VSSQWGYCCSLSAHRGQWRHRPDCYGILTWVALRTYGALCSSLLHIGCCLLAVVYRQHIRSSLLLCTLRQQVLCKTFCASHLCTQQQVLCSQSTLVMSSGLLYCLLLSIACAEAIDLKKGPDGSSHLKRVQTYNVSAPLAAGLLPICRSGQHSSCRRTVAARGCCRWYTSLCHCFIAFLCSASTRNCSGRGR